MSSLSLVVTVIVLIGRPSNLHVIIEPCGHCYVYDYPLKHARRRELFGKLPWVAVSCTYIRDKDSGRVTIDPDGQPRV